GRGSDAATAPARGRGCRAAGARGRRRPGGALVGVAHRDALGQPRLLERFVLLVELAAVELLDTPPQARRRRLRAAAAALTAAGSEAVHCRRNLAAARSRDRLLLRSRASGPVLALASRDLRQLCASLRGFGVVAPCEHVLRVVPSRHKSLSPGLSILQG